VHTIQACRKNIGVKLEIISVRSQTGVSEAAVKVNNIADRTAWFWATPSGISPDR